MTNFLYNAIFLIGQVAGISGPNATVSIAKEDTLKVKYTADFEIKGDGSATNWSNSEWL